MALNPLTLETVDDYYTFNGGLQGQTFTAHPKIDPQTGELVAFGYEAKGLATDDVFVFSADPKGAGELVGVAEGAVRRHDPRLRRHAEVRDLLREPDGHEPDVIKNAGPHFAWDSTLPSYLGIMRRGGDGKDLRWFKGPGYMATHTMGA